MAQTRIYAYEHEVFEQVTASRRPDDIVVRSTTLPEHRVWARRMWGPEIQPEEHFLDYRHPGQLVSGGILPLYYDGGQIHGNKYFTSMEVTLFIQTYGLLRDFVYMDTRILPSLWTPDWEREHQARPELFVMLYSTSGYRMSRKIRLVTDALDQIGVPLEDGGIVWVEQGEVFKARVDNQMPGVEYWRAAVQDDYAGWINFDHGLLE